MAYRHSRARAQRFEFAAIEGADLLAEGDTSLSIGDSFAVLLAASATTSVTDNDRSLSGDAHRNERDDDPSDADNLYVFQGNAPIPGAELTIVSTGNMRGDWVKYEDLSSDLDWRGDADDTICMLAENLQLSHYRVEENRAASEVMRVKHV